jgi:SAM-dependent methyltransferase
MPAGALAATVPAGVDAGAGAVVAVGAAAGDVVEVAGSFFGQAKRPALRRRRIAIDFVLMPKSKLIPMKADYGIDAPGVIRNLLIVAAVGLAAWATMAAGLWSGVVAIGSVRLALARMLLWPAIGCGAMAIWMLYDSKIGKVRDREQLLDRIPWRGDERVLDVGCGRGLMLVGAAKRLTTGRATGIDIWQAEDLSGNCPEATLENAEREGVRERVEVKTADMRKLPFDDAAFDVVVSCAAIHNLYDAGDRAQAIREIARVLKPGGRALIDDIRHFAEYARVFGAEGFAVRRSGSRFVSAFLAIVTFGSLRPATLLGEKR